MELAGFGGEGDGGVVADYFETNLVHHFGNHGVHLGGHNRRAGLHFRQVDFFQAGTRAGGEQAQVVADFGELHGGALQGAVHHHIGAAVGGGFNQVFGELAWQAADFGEFLHGQRCVALRRVDACTDGSGAEVYFQQQLAGAFEVGFFFCQQHLEGLEFLAGSHGHGILQLGAAHF